MKISIIGHCGSGKSTLAKTLSTTHHISHLEIDKLWFKHSGGVAAKTELEKASISEQIKFDVEGFLAEHKHWVSDGVYGNVQTQISAAAEQIIFIDIPLPRRLLNHLSRWVRQTNQHSELSRFQDFKFIFDMQRRTRVTQPKIDLVLEQFPEKTKILTSYADVAKFVESVPGLR